MVRTGPNSRLAVIEKSVVELLLSHGIAHGMGFREIYRYLQTKPKVSRAGSFSTLSVCLRNLMANEVLFKSVVTKKYFLNPVGFSQYDRDLVTEAILKANVLGGGRLFQPASGIVGYKIRIPEKKPEVFTAVDVFIQANLKGINGWPNEGAQYIETFQGDWAEKHPENNVNTKSTSSTYPEPLHFTKLVMQRLSAKRTARDWIKAIWDYARKNKLVDNDLTLDKASNQDLERILNEIFLSARVETIVFTEFIEPKKLFEWWKQSKQERT